MEIREIGNSLEKSFKGNGKYILIGGGVLLLVLLLTNSKETGEDSGQWVTPTGYSAYPDAVTNANVIMDEVNNHTSAEIANLNDSLQLQYGILNDYVTEGVDRITEEAQKNKDEIVNQIVTSETNIEETVKEWNEYGANDVIVHLDKLNRYSNSNTAGGRNERLYN